MDNFVQIEDHDNLWFDTLGGTRLLDLFDIITVQHRDGVINWLLDIDNTPEEKAYIESLSNRQLIEMLFARRFDPIGGALTEGAVRWNTTNYNVVKTTPDGDNPHHDWAIVISPFGFYGDKTKTQKAIDEAFWTKA